MSAPDEPWRAFFAESLRRLGEILRHHGHRLRMVLEHDRLFQAAGIEIGPHQLLGMLDRIGAVLDDPLSDRERGPMQIGLRHDLADQTE